MGQIVESFHLQLLRCLIIQHTVWAWPVFLVQTHCIHTAGAQPNTSLLKNKAAFTQSAGVTRLVPMLTNTSSSENRCEQEFEAPRREEIWDGCRQTAPFLQTSGVLSEVEMFSLVFPPLSDFPFPLSSWLTLPEQQGDILIVRRYTEFAVLFIGKVKADINQKWWKQP